MVIGANYPTELGVVADLQLALSAMNAALAGRSLPQFGGAARIADIKARKFARFDTLAQRSGDQIRPEMVIDALNHLLPETATVVSDPGTSCPYWSAYGKLTLPGRRFITNRAHGRLAMR